MIPEQPPVGSSTPETQQDTTEDDAVGSTELLDSQKNQARHYKTLQDMYRRFITSDVLKPQERATQILEAYPCSKQLDHVMDEMQRIIQPNNGNYIGEIKDRWDNFFSKVQFYGVMKKAMTPPTTLNGVDHTSAVFAALPSLFPSSTSPPKKRLRTLKDSCSSEPCLAQCCSKKYFKTPSMLKMLPPHPKRLLKSGSPSSTNELPHQTRRRTGKANPRPPIRHAGPGYPSSENWIRAEQALRRARCNTDHTQPEETPRQGSRLPSQVQASVPCHYHRKGARHRWPWKGVYPPPPHSRNL
uniref:uncharacterized protein LOC131137433 n=1 Tax=Doryrhamphus excisus TaxID=161450 RepID=UPI0025AE508E|nr:uncharacterized protein LOC131137433 [Doryrhamphus excisus]XP_057941389.1 uncharacterized protein LOC131137433 [Doryrhamphus excisus]XP_057941390.1 uncharacterized protein LOC131137433 [Doryrhamphus excisus]XP_057941391.1 uncharacterized protein LOC131137433 [Doryrhamphus excisus]XP_057941392.1 uncharacterized protein LOC131137433 [Doryrhamphus excisus]